jgi:hypothetical protein
MCTSNLRVQLEVPCSRIKQWHVCEFSFIVLLEYASEDDFSEVFSVRTSADIQAKYIYIPDFIIWNIPFLRLCYECSLYAFISVGLRMRVNVYLYVYSI